MAGPVLAIGILLASVPILRGEGSPPEPIQRLINGPYNTTGHSEGRKDEVTSRRHTSTSRIAWPRRR
jgi:hypothetical protein